MVFFLLIGGLVTTLLMIWFFGGDGQIFGMETDQFGELAMLTAIAAFVVASFSGERLKLSRVVRDASIWLAIIGAIAAGYVFQDDLRPVWRKIQAELSPGSAISVDGETVTIVSQGSDFRLDGRVNGSNVEFIFDTGASVVVLTPDDARKAGLETQGLKYLVPVQTANGQTFAAATILNQVSVGPIVYNRVRALISKPGDLRTSLLGMSFISRLSEHTIRGNKLILQN